MAYFEGVGLGPELIQAVEDMDWNTPTDVQDEAMPLILGGSDVMIAAETGSGKTGAFCLPGLQLLYEHLRGEARVDMPARTSDAAADKAGQDGAIDVRFDPAYADQIANISPDGRSVQTREQKRWGGARTNVGFLPKGKWFFEVEVQDEGLCRIGVCTQRAQRDLGTDALGFGFGGTGKAVHNRRYDDYGRMYGMGDVVGCLVDFDVKCIRFSLNGEDQGKAFGLPPQVAGEPLFPAVWLKNAQVMANFGSTPFRYPPSAAMGGTGFQSLSTAQLSETSAGQQHASSAPSGGQPADARPGARDKSGGPSPPLMLVMEPTRELAEQVSQEIEKFKKYLKEPSIKQALFIGGGEMRSNLQALQTGPHIVVGTPGVLAALIKSNKLKLNQLRLLVLDEADQLLETGNRTVMTHIHSACAGQVQVVICSATLHDPAIADLSKHLCHEPQWVDLKGKDSVPETVEHVVLEVDPRADNSWRNETFPTDGIHEHLRTPTQGFAPDVLSFAIKRRKPRLLLQVIEAFQMDQCIIFCRTQVDCDNVEKTLVAAGGGGGGFQGKVESGKENIFSCAVLHGGRRQEERQANLQAFRDGDVRFLISSDVGARGLDISGLPFIVNFTMPDKPEYYIHRVGRVGRAGNPGLAISLIATEKERVWYHDCKRQDRGRGCRQMGIKKEIAFGKYKGDGCNIWYDEPGLRKMVEQRLGLSQAGGLPVLNLSELQQGTAAILARAAAVRAQADMLSGGVESRAHVEYMSPVAERLAGLEVQAQQTFLVGVPSNLTNRWRSMLSGATPSTEVPSSSSAASAASAASASASSSQPAQPSTREAGKPPPKKKKRAGRGSRQSSDRQ
eukprot:g7851.t1